MESQFTDEEIEGFIRYAEKTNYPYTRTKVMNASKEQCLKAKEAVRLILPHEYAKSFTPEQHAAVNQLHEFLAVVYHKLPYERSYERANRAKSVGKAALTIMILCCFSSFASADLIVSSQGQATPQGYFPVEIVGQAPREVVFQGQEHLLPVNRFFLFGDQSGNEQSFIFDLLSPDQSSFTTHNVISEYWYGESQSLIQGHEVMSGNDLGLKPRNANFQRFTYNGSQRFAWLQLHGVQAIPEPAAALLMLCCLPFFRRVRS